LMRIPFADAVLNRLSRRGAGLDLIEEIEDEAGESVDAAELLPAEPALLLQRMENRLIRHQRGDVSVGAEIAPWRSRVADALYGPLREEPDPITALTTARDALESLAAAQDDQRQ